MLRVRIEMLPHGDEEKAHTIGLILIANEGTGTNDAASYEYAISHTGKYLQRNKEAWKSGTVHGFRRKIDTCYKLIRMVLSDARF